MIGKSVSCVARNQAEQILERLRFSGFSRNNISVLFARAKGAEESSMERAMEWLGFAGPLTQAESIIVGGPTLVSLASDDEHAFKSIAEALGNFGIEEEEAKRYEEAVKAGGILFSVVVSSQDGVDRARWIFEDAAADQISTTRESRILEQRRADMPEPDPASKRVRRKRFGRPFFS